MKPWHTAILAFAFFLAAEFAFVMADKKCTVRGGILVTTVIHGAKCIKAEVIP